MARPSKLTPEQWRSVEERFHNGESASALAREFGVDEAAIRRRFRRDSPKVREAAELLAEAQSAIAALPIHQRPIAIGLAEKLRGISDNLASAAHYGAATAHRLAGIANAQVERVSDSDPMESQETLQAISALTKMSNEASTLGVALLNANREAANKIINPPQAASDGPVKFYLPTNGR